MLTSPSGNRYVVRGAWFLCCRWLTEVKPTLPKSHALVYDCTLGPGEVLFIGHQWWHATLNIGQTVFISTFI